MRAIITQSWEKLKKITGQANNSEMRPVMAEIQLQSRFITKQISIYTAVKSGQCTCIYVNNKANIIHIRQIRSCFRSKKLQQMHRTTRCKFCAKHTSNTHLSCYRSNLQKILLLLVLLVKCGDISTHEKLLLIQECKFPKWTRNWQYYSAVLVVT